MRQTVRPDQRSGWTEQANELCGFVIGRDASSVRLTAPQKATVFRAIFSSTVRVKPEESAPILALLANTETKLVQDLRRPTDDEIREGVRYAVTPLFTATLNRG